MWFLAHCSRAVSRRETPISRFYWLLLLAIHKVSLRRWIVVGVQHADLGPEGTGSGVRCDTAVKDGDHDKGERTLVGQHQAIVVSSFCAIGKNLLLVEA